MATDKTLGKIAADLSEPQNTLLFTALKDLGDASKEERRKEETYYKKLLAETGGDCLYNVQNYIPSTGRLTQTTESRELIRQSSLSRPVTIDTQSYPCICEGKWYETRAAASRAYGYKTPDGLKYKLNNPQEVKFIWLKNPLNKPIPDDPEIKRKVDLFFKYLVVRPLRIIQRKPQDTDS